MNLADVLGKLCVEGVIYRSDVPGREIFVSENGQLVYLNNTLKAFEFTKDDILSIKWKVKYGGNLFPVEGRISAKIERLLDEKWHKLSSNEKGFLRAFLEQEYITEDQKDMLEYTYVRRMVRNEHFAVTLENIRNGSDEEFRSKVRK